MGRFGATQLIEGYGIVIDPLENRNREARMTKNPGAVEAAGELKSKSARTAADEVFTLERRSRRRLQKKAFIAKARSDAA